MADVDGEVIKYIRKILTNPEIIGKTWSDTKQFGVSDEEVFVSLKNIDQLWDHLFPLEQQSICHILVEQVLLGHDGLEVSFKQDGLIQLLDTKGLGHVKR